MIRLGYACINMTLQKQKTKVTCLVKIQKGFLENTGESDNIR